MAPFGTLAVMLPPRERDPAPESPEAVLMVTGVCSAAGARLASLLRSLVRVVSAALARLTSLLRSFWSVAKLVLFTVSPAKLGLALLLMSCAVARVRVPPRETLPPPDRPAPVPTVIDELTSEALATLPATKLAPL